MASVSYVDGKWRALVRRKGHKPISKRFERKREADAWGAMIEAQIDAGQVPKLTAKGVTIAQRIKQYREMRAQSRPILDTSTEHYTLKQLDRNLGEIVDAALTVDDLIGWARARHDDGAGPYTVNCDLGKLGTVLRYTGEGLPDVVGAARPKLRHLGLIGGGGLRERRPVEDELERIVEWLTIEKGVLYADVVRFAVATAMRRGEIATVVWADVDRTKKLLLIRNRKHPRQKIGNDQWIPLLPAAWEVLQRQSKTPDEPRIFPVHPQTISKYFREACVALGVPDLHLHDMRHEGTSKLFEDGYTIEEVPLVTGHKDWRALKRYTNLKPESLHDRGKRPGK